jgi:hypothetical protein
MNYDEEYWRAKAVEAQRVAQNYYDAAMLTREHAPPSVARLWQSEAYDVHLKALARLGWAEVERNNAHRRYKVLLIDHDPSARFIADVQADLKRWTLDRRGKS